MSLSRIAGMSITAGVTSIAGEISPGTPPVLPSISPSASTVSTFITIPWHFIKKLAPRSTCVTRQVYCSSPSGTIAMSPSLRAMYDGGSVNSICCRAEWLFHSSVRASF